jgi:hypothetical protein
MITDRNIILTIPTTIIILPDPETLSGNLAPATDIRTLTDQILIPDRENRITVTTEITVTTVTTVTMVITATMPITGITRIAGYRETMGILDIMGAMLEITATIIIAGLAGTTETSGIIRVKERQVQFLVPAHQPEEWSKLHQPGARMEIR